jgi:hypothetical protein
MQPAGSSVSVAVRLLMGVFVCRSSSTEAAECSLLRLLSVSSCLSSVDVLLWMRM